MNSLIGSISTLSNLDLSHNIMLSSILESIGNLRKLHTLELSHCYYLEKLPDSIYRMASLKVIKLGHVRLDESVVSRLNCALLPHFEVRASGDKCSSNIILLQPTNPNELMVGRLENVKSAEEPHSIKLIEKEKIKVLKIQWTVAARRFVEDKVVLEKLVPPRGVEILSIVGYRSVSLPDWLMDIRQHLPNLAKIILADFPKCSKLPPLGQQPNLQSLELCHMEGLEEWNTTYYSGKEGSNELMFPRLEWLRIIQCAKLRIKPCLPRAMSLYIRDSDTMLSSWGESCLHSGTSSSSTLTAEQYLNVDESKVPMHQWRLLHHLPPLESLVITNCSDLTTSPQIIHSLSSLITLKFEILSFQLPRWLVELTSLQEQSMLHCETMLPEWLGELTSLKRLDIRCCRRIRSLPESIQQLTRLEYLCIMACPKLEKWCKSEENKIKLAHIRKVFLSIDNPAKRNIGYDSSLSGEASDDSNGDTAETSNSQVDRSFSWDTPAISPYDLSVASDESDSDEEEDKAETVEETCNRRGTDW